MAYQELQRGLESLIVDRPKKKALCFKVPFLMLLNVIKITFLPPHFLHQGAILQQLGMPALSQRDQSLV